MNRTIYLNVVIKNVTIFLFLILIHTYIVVNFSNIAQSHFNQKDV